MTKEQHCVYQIMRSVVNMHTKEFYGKILLAVDRLILLDRQYWEDFRALLNKELQEKVKYETLRRFTAGYQNALIGSHEGHLHRDAIDFRIIAERIALAELREFHRNGFTSLTRN